MKMGHKSGIVYQYKCQYEGCDAVYTGESSKNFQTRAKWHMDKFNQKNGGSFMTTHQTNKHGGQEPNFEMKVLKLFKDPLSRQAAEGVFITKTQGEILNSKSEFFQPSIVTVRREVSRGL